MNSHGLGEGGGGLGHGDAGKDNQGYQALGKLNY